MLSILIRRKSSFGKELRDQNFWKKSVKRFTQEAKLICEIQLNSREGLWRRRFLKIQLYAIKEKTFVPPTNPHVFQAIKIS